VISIEIHILFLSILLSNYFQDTKMIFYMQ